MTDWKDLRKELLKDPEFKAEYEKMQPKFEAVSAFCKSLLRLWAKNW